MYNCRNCGGNLRFDIPSQRLLCPYCHSDFDCYELEDSAGQDMDSYDVTVFSCPQCGGEIISSDQSVSEFCSYCGSSVQLNARLRREKRPAKIIPFKVTAENCKDAYVRKLKGAVFAPSELKKPQFLENFRGIYVPYWSYGFEYHGPVTLKSSHDYRRGDYDITDYYNVSGQIDASYNGICYDASSSFDDAISEAIAPYDPREMQDFVPSYLSGFYGDISDVPADTYLDQANDMANDATIDVIGEDPVAGKYPISVPANIKTVNKNLGTIILEPVAAMLPVWFLTWRNRDRVAYMTVNGQTGKVSADIPIDEKKYVGASLLFAIPLYFILNFLLSLRASTSLVIAGLFALAAGVIYYEEVRRIVRRDNREEDRGFQYARREREKQEARRKREETLDGVYGMEDGETKVSVVERNSKKYRQKMAAIKAEQRKKAKQNRQKEKEKGKDPLGLIFRIFIILAMIPAFLWIVLCVMAGINAIFSGMTINLLLLAATFVLWYLVYNYSRKETVAYHAHLEIMGSQLAALIAAIIGLISPISDVIYYIGMALAYLGIFTTLIQIIRRYNLLITRPIPEFHYRGKEQP
ncbi:MAG: hypothetical protein IJ137_01260 [Eubacterium sp.]|nr:hypothetical protein [Eubacterium sp.]